MVQTTTVRVVTGFSMEFVEILNVNTGKALTLEMAGRSPLGFTGRQAEVWNMLANLDSGVTVEMDARTLNTFVRMTKGEQEPAATPVAVANAAKVETRSAKSDVVAHELRKVAPASVDTAESRIQGMRKVAERIKDDTYVLLQYDIPESVKTDAAPTAEGVDTYPCPILWRHGFRMTKSVWVMPSKQVGMALVQNLLNGWKAFNADPARTGKQVKFRILPFAEETMEEIRRMAVEAIDEYIRELHTSLIECIANADESLRKAMERLDADEKAGLEVTAKQVERTEATRDNAVRAILKKKGEELNLAIASAELFDATEDVADLLRALRQAIRANVGSFNERARQAGRKLSDVAV